MIEGRNPAVDDTFVRMHFGWRQRQDVREGVTGLGNAIQHVTELRLVSDQAQQGLAACARLADTEQVLGSRIHRGDQQRSVEQNDARRQSVKDAGGIEIGKAVAGFAATVIGQKLTVFCCT